MKLAKLAAGSLWFLSWCFLYYEIFGWHHVSTSLHLQPPAPPPGYPPPHPGNFLIAVLTGSALMPAIYFVLALIEILDERRKGAEAAERY